MSFHLCYLDENGVCVSTRAAEENSQETERRILINVDDIETYVGRTYLEGVWSDELPIVYDPKNYVTRFRMSQMKNHMLTEDEFIATGDSDNPVLKKVARLGRERNGWVDVDHHLFHQAMDAMLDAGIIDEARKVQLQKGLPVEFADLL